MVATKAMHGYITNYLPQRRNFQILKVFGKQKTSKRKVVGWNSFAPIAGSELASKTDFDPTPTVFGSTILEHGGSPRESFGGSLEGFRGGPLKGSIGRVPMHTRGAGCGRRLYAFIYLRPSRKF